MKSPELVELVELEGNDPVLVGLSVPAGRQPVLMSRKTGKMWLAKGTVEGRWHRWLAEDDYLLLCCEQPDSKNALRTRSASRFLVREGRAIAYCLPCLLPHEPERSTRAHLSAPTLAQLVACGKADGQARIVARWLAATRPVCVGIRHEQWHGGWLFFKGHSPSVGLCLPDGAYEARAALLDEQDALCSSWSDVCGFSVADGRLCVVDVGIPDKLADALSVRRAWTAGAALESASLREMREEKQLVRVDWTWSGSTSIGFIVSWLAIDEFRWHFVTCRESHCDLKIGLGTYRIRVAACDFAALQRSPILTEGVLEVSATEVRLNSVDLTCLGAAKDRKINVKALDEFGKSSVRRFKAYDLAPLSQCLVRDAAARAAAADALDLAEPSTSREAIKEVVLMAADPVRLLAMGKAFAKVGRLEDARQVFEAYRRQFRQGSTGPGWLGHVAEREGRPREALNLYSAASVFPGQAKWLYHALRMHLALRDDSVEHYAPRVLELMASEGWAPAAFVALAALRGETSDGPLLSALFEASGLETSGGLCTPVPASANSGSGPVGPLGSQSTISVILPLSEHTHAMPLGVFSKALLSIVNQSHANTEIVVCAPTARVASDFSHAFNSMVHRMRVYQVAGNWTAACLDIAKGEYLTVLDARVTSHRERFARQLEILEESMAGSICLGVNTDETGRPLLPAGGPLQPLPESLLVRRSRWKSDFAQYFGEVGYCENMLRELPPETVATVPLPLCAIRNMAGAPGAVA